MSKHHQFSLLIFITLLLLLSNLGTGTTYNICSSLQLGQTPSLEMVTKAEARILTFSYILISWQASQHCFCSSLKDSHDIRWSISQAVKAKHVLERQQRFSELANIANTAHVPCYQKCFPVETSSTNPDTVGKRWKNYLPCPSPTF